MNISVYQAREAHRQVRNHSAHASRFRVERNKLIRDLYLTGEFSYGSLAAAVGCSTQLIAKVVHGR